MRFSRGNLWCDADYGDYDYDFVVKEGRFHFEKNQYDFNASRRTGFMDADHVSLFFWCKDANNSVCYRYHLKEWDNYDGVLFTNETENTPNPNFEVDGQKGFWRTLSKTEWEYLLNRKDKDGNLLYRKNVSVTWSGLVLLPDDWDWSTAPGGWWKSEYSETTSPKWSEMEAAGAVFLPGAGSRDASSSDAGSVAGNWARYWTSSWVDKDNAYRLDFESTPRFDDTYRYWALSIRVVTEVK